MGLHARFLHECLLCAAHNCRTNPSSYQGGTTLLAHRQVRHREASTGRFLLDTVMVLSRVNIKRDILITCENLV